MARGITRIQVVSEIPHVPVRRDVRPVWIAVSLQRNQRITFYACWVYSDQLIADDPYTLLRPVISLCVLTTPMLSNVCELHLEFWLLTATGVKLTDDLQVHLLQLSNLTVTAQNVPTAAPIEQWAYFLLNVEHLALDEVKRLFPDPVFTEAAGVLEMVSKSPEQRHQYDARVKFQRDEAARLEQARNEGIEQGIEQGIERGRREGELLGQIKLLQQLVGIAVPTPVELLSFNEVQLSELAEQMKRQLRTRGE